SLLRLSGVAGDDRQGGACLSKPPGDAQANAAVAASHDGDFARQVEEVHHDLNSIFLVRSLPARSACHTQPVSASSAVNQPPRAQLVSMQTRKPRSSTSPENWGVCPTTATFPE